MAPTWVHVLFVECMRTATSLGGPVPTLKQETIKSRVVISPFAHIHQNQKKTNLEKKILAFFPKFLN
jgi:hypothetical protein